MNRAWARGHSTRASQMPMLAECCGESNRQRHVAEPLDAQEQAVVSVGIPTDEDPENHPECAVGQWHALPAIDASDYGDDWQPVSLHEGFESADDDQTYPRDRSNSTRRR